MYVYVCMYAYYYNLKLKSIDYLLIFYIHECINKYQSRSSDRNTSKSLEQFSTLPNQPGLQLDYDYLAPSSLSAIELLPHIKRNKGDWFLTKWWNAAKKWNLLTGKPTSN